MMKNLFKAGIIAFAFGLMFVSVDTVNGQNKEKRKEAKREYRGEIREARREYRDDIRNGDNRREARREYRGEKRDAKRDYRQSTGRRINRGYHVSRSNRGYAVSSSRRAYPQRSRVYYRNGRRYVRSY